METTISVKAGVVPGDGFGRDVQVLIQTGGVDQLISPWLIAVLSAYPGSSFQLAEDVEASEHLAPAGTGVFPHTEAGSILLKGDSLPQQGVVVHVFSGKLRFVPARE